MYTYNIKENGYPIGTAQGKHKAFEFIQKEIDRNKLKGYWRGDSYIIEDKEAYKMEVSNE